MLMKKIKHLEQPPIFEIIFKFIEFRLDEHEKIAHWSEKKVEKIEPSAIGHRSIMASSLSKRFLKDRLLILRNFLRRLNYNRHY